MISPLLTTLFFALILQSFVLICVVAFLYEINEELRRELRSCREVTRRIKGDLRITRDLPKKEQLDGRGLDEDDQ